MALIRPYVPVIFFGAFVLGSAGGSKYGVDVWWVYLGGSIRCVVGVPRR